MFILQNIDNMLHLWDTQQCLFENDHHYDAILHNNLTNNGSYLTTKVITMLDVIFKVGPGALI